MVLLETLEILKQLSLQYFPVDVDVIVTPYEARLEHITDRLSCEKLCQPRRPSGRNALALRTRTQDVEGNVRYRPVLKTKADMPAQGKDQRAEGCRIFGSHAMQTFPYQQFPHSNLQTAMPDSGRIHAIATLSMSLMNHDRFDRRET